MAGISDRRLAQLLERRFGGDNQISRPKIQRAPVFLRQNPDFAKYCSPKIISFGPIHHRNENLQQGEEFKSQWTFLYIREYGEKTNKSKDEAAQFLLDITKARIGELRQLFTEDVIQNYNDMDLAWMLLVDGCSLLFYMEHVDIHHPEELMLKLDHLMYIWRDILLLENQLPIRLLELLSKKQGEDLEYLLANFNHLGEAKRKQLEIVALPNKPKPIHVLDYARSYFIGIENGNNVRNQQDGDEPPPAAEESHFWQTYKNVRDLKKAGIQVMKNKTDEWKWNNISFTSRWLRGELRLPVFLFNDVTPYFFRNLIAYELCLDFCHNYECCSYFSFMDSLIDEAEDVKELRLAGVFQNLLGNDEEVAKLFNEIGHDLPTKMFNQVGTDAVAYSKKYIQVKHQIEKHYSNKWKTWLAEARNTYFNNPWSLTAVLAAVLALILTFIQTWYAAHPKKK